MIQDIFALEKHKLQSQLQLHKVVQCASLDRSVPRVQALQLHVQQENIVKNMHLVFLLENAKLGIIVQKALPQRIRTFVTLGNIVL